MQILIDEAERRVFLNATGVRVVIGNRWSPKYNKLGSDTVRYNPYKSIEHKSSDLLEVLTYKKNKDIPGRYITIYKDGVCVKIN